MTCWLIRRRLLKLSPAELAVPSGDGMRRHLRHCPGCDRLREIFLSLNKDLLRGATPEQHRHLPIKLDIISGKSIFSNSLISYWRKLDWWLMPEKSLGWAFAALLVITFAGIAYQRLPVAPTAQSGFPNDLVIARGRVMVTVDPERGLHLSNSSIAPIIDHGNDSGAMRSKSHKGAI